MINNRFDTLSRRHREVLRLVYDRRVTKEIAEELGLGLGTVNTYITEATRILQARNRRDASELLAMHEGRHPLKVEFESEGVSIPAALVPGPAPTAPSLWTLLPFRQPGAQHNDLDLIVRLAWIPSLAIAFAVGFGMLALALRVISDLIRGALAP